MLNSYRYLRAGAVVCCAVGTCVVRLDAALRQSAAVKLDGSFYRAKALHELCTLVDTITGRLSYLALPAGLQGQVLTARSMAEGYLREEVPAQAPARLTGLTEALLCLLIGLMRYLEVRALDVLTYAAAYKGQIPGFTGNQEAWIYLLLDMCLGNCKSRQYLTAVGSTVGTGTLPVRVAADAVDPAVLQTLYSGELFDWRPLPDESTMQKLEYELDGMILSLDDVARRYMLRRSVDLADIYSGRADCSANGPSIDVANAVIRFVDALADPNGMEADTLPVLDRSQAANLLDETLETIGRESA